MPEYGLICSYKDTFTDRFMSVYYPLLKLVSLLEGRESPIGRPGVGCRGCLA
jgi:hypothetical protein